MRAVAIQVVVLLHHPVWQGRCDHSHISPARQGDYLHFCQDYVGGIQRKLQFKYACISIKDKPLELDK